MKGRPKLWLYPPSLNFLLIPQVYNLVPVQARIRNPCFLALFLGIAENLNVPCTKGVDPIVNISPLYHVFTKEDLCLGISHDEFLHGPDTVPIWSNH